VPPAAPTDTPVIGVLPATGPGAQPPAAPPEVLPATGGADFSPLVALLIALGLSAVSVAGGIYLKRKRIAG
jgi:hypothetical protein